MENLNMEKLDLEERGHGIKRYWLVDKRIVVYELFGSTPPKVDTWVQEVHDTVAQWPEGRPYLGIHHCNIGVTVTPYVRRQAFILAEQYAHLNGRSAVVVSDNLASKVFGFFVNQNLNRIQAVLQRRMFYQLEDAVGWLLAHENDSAESSAEGE